MIPPLALTASRRASGAALRLVAFGSSTTAGYGASDPARTGYAAVMRAALAPAFAGGVALVNLGVSGECVEEMSGRIDGVLAAAPDLVIWQSGSNDAPRGVSRDRFERLMQAGIETIRDRTGADLVLMEPQWCTALEATPGSRAMLEAMRGLAAANRIELYPRHALMQVWARQTGLGIEGLSPDGTHMEDRGYAMLGRSVASFVLERSGPVSRTA